jgi:hypothetical protein
VQRGWFKRLGFGGSYAVEVGSAALKNAATGASLSYQVKQQRWSFDLRYAILAGARVVILPALGFGNNSFDLKRTMAPSPMMCNSTATEPCLTDVGATQLVADLHIRIAATDTFGFSVAGGYYMGVGAPAGNWTQNNERVAKMSGYHAEVGANILLSDWLAVRGSLPFVHYGYAFSGGNGTGVYTSASETYYGLNIGAIIFTR